MRIECSKPAPRIKDKRTKIWKNISCLARYTPYDLIIVETISESYNGSTFSSRIQGEADARAEVVAIGSIDPVAPVQKSLERICGASQRLLIKGLCVSAHWRSSYIRIGRREFEFERL